MDLSALASKQKRLKDWTQFSESEVQSEHIRVRFNEALSGYKAALAQCWKQGKISPNDEQVLADIERQLEQLDEEARLTVVGKERLTAVPRFF